MKIDFNDNLELVFTGSGRPYRKNTIYIRTQVFNERLGLAEHEYFVFESRPQPTDGASIPRIVWIVLAPFDMRILYPSQPHDDLYERKNKTLKGVVWNKVTGKIIREERVEYTRLDADRMLPEKMKSYGAGPIIRFIAFWAVRLGGKKGYNI